tara:strand:- start:180 stop:584 length:405 start_codon:yes stop_codon:yes gene_type:complete
MPKHLSGGFWSFAIAQQWIEPAAQHQEPSQAESSSDQAPSPPASQGQINRHACCDQNKAISTAQHQHQQEKPKAWAFSSFGPKRQCKGWHRPGFWMEVEKYDVENHWLQPPQATHQPALTQTQSSLTSQPPDWN